MEDVAVSAWATRRVFVTGATGIVGSWLCRRLVDEGAYVVALVRDWDPQSELIRSGVVNRLNVVQGALEDYGALERAIAGHDIDSVFHLGAQTIVGTAHRSPLATFESNIRGSYNLLEACRVQSGLLKCVVVASSDKAYGDSDVLPYVEGMPLDGRHPYDVSKSCTDLLTLTYANTYDLPASVARCGNIFGGGDLNWSRIVPGTILAALEGKRPVLRSDGSYTRDYIYVEDVVDAYLCIAEATADGAARGQAFNFGPGKGTDVLGITRATLRAVGRDDLEPIILNEAKAEIRHQVLDASKARAKLGWTPRFTIEEGLRRTVIWYRDFCGRR